MACQYIPECEPVSRIRERVPHHFPPSAERGTNGSSVDGVRHEFARAYTPRLSGMKGDMRGDDARTGLDIVVHEQQEV